jgi:predicted DCC family thiol-disulfide oxidoreductase YuxK
MKAGDMMEQIILFDGVCNLCSSSVQFVIKRDPKGYFKFASLQSEAAQKLLKKYNLNTDMNSFVLISDDKVYLKSTAALLVCWKLNGLWKVLTILLIIPRFFRDFLYETVAKNRYKWFRKNQSCMLPLTEWKNRFLD